MPDFDGATYAPEQDQERLTNQQAQIRQLMLDGVWRTPEEVAQTLGLRLTSGTTARIRDLRKPRWGGYNVESRRRGAASDGLWEYRVNGLLSQQGEVNPFADEPQAAPESPEDAFLAAGREYAETCRQTSDPEELQAALERLGRAALELP